MRSRPAFSPPLVTITRSLHRSPPARSIRSRAASSCAWRPVRSRSSIDVTEKAGHYVGTAQLKQSDFGIKPIRIAGGTVRVKDELRLEFNIQLAPSDVT